MPANEINTKLHLTPFMVEISADLVAELEFRLERSPSERDQVAITSAITKAAWRGALRGSAEQLDAINEQVPGLKMTASFDRPPDDTEPDPWADKYGQEE